MGTINVNGISVHNYQTDDTAIRKKGASDDPNYEVRGDKAGNRGRVNNHEDKQIKELAKHHDSGLYNTIQIKIMTGEELTSKEMKELKEMALFFTPNFLNQAVVDGDITQQDADMLIMAGGLLVGGVSEQDLGRSLANFFSLNGEDRQFALDVMSDRTIEYDAKVKDRVFKSDKITYTETHSAPNPEQGRLSIFLSNMQPGQQGHIQNYTNWSFDTSNNALAATLSDITDFVNLDDTQKDALIGHLQNLGHGWAAVPNHGHNPGTDRGPADGPIGGPGHGRPIHNPGGEHTRPGEVLPPSVLADMGIGDQGRVDLGTLMFQVMADRVESLDNQVREFADMVDQQNKQLSTNTNAMAALRANLSDGGSAVNLTNVTFEDGQGNTVSLVGYLANEGMLKADADMTSVSQTDLNSMLTTIDEKNDVLNSESTSTMTKLQQNMDKYQQAVQMQTNFESKWNSMLQAIIGNLGR